MRPILPRGEGWRRSRREQLDRPHAGSPVTGTVTVPGSKSVTNRALLLAGLSGGGVRVDGAPPTRDTALMTGALAALGVPVTTLGDTGWRSARTPGCAAGPPRRPPRSTAGSPARSCGSSPGRGDGVRCGPLRRRPARPGAPDGHRAGRAARTRCHRVLRRRRRRTAVRARRRPGPGRRGHDRRVGVVAVRVRAAAVRVAVRARRDRVPRGRAAAVAAAHRDDRGDAARRRGGRRRHRAEHLAGRARPGRGADWSVEPDLSNASVFLAAAVVTGGGSPCAAGRPRPPSPASTSCRCWSSSAPRSRTAPTASP
ncbi:hypothetical protein L7F22_060374 [Adiantum nelumboides]|nr:hypothetical protein [Adiantum nelumboides]